MHTAALFQRATPWMRCALAAPLTALAQAGALPEPPNWLSFAQGALPLRVEADAPARTGIEQAIAVVDGHPGVFALTARVPSTTRVVLLYQLAAPTVFERLSVPNVIETPSPSQSFVREVRVTGSATSADDGFVPIAAGTLQAHRSRSQRSDLTLQRHGAVRWVRVELSGALDPAQREGTLEFSELIGHGRQEPPGPPADFGGAWQGKGLRLVLRQHGALVQGCYDRTGALQGSVGAGVLRASGQAADSGVVSGFVAGFAGAGAQRALYVLRSTNRAPFRLSVAGPAGSGATPACQVPADAVPGCGSVLHGIGFDFDSATLRPESAPVLDALQRGLARSSAARIRIEGHTSSEGDAAYNQRLSERRAAAVVDALAQRGLERARLGAAGLGERQPLAPNDDEAGRTLNRRVEVHCTG